MNKELQFLIYNTPQENIKVGVVVKDETIWLTQKGMSALFDVEIPAINNPAAERTGYVVLPEKLHSGAHTLIPPQSGGVCTPSARISKHLSNIFESGELDKKVVVSILEITTEHGDNLQVLFSEKKMLEGDILEQMEKLAF